MKSTIGSQFYINKLTPQAFFASSSSQTIKRTQTPNFALRENADTFRSVFL